MVRCSDFVIGCGFYTGVIFDPTGCCERLFVEDSSINPHGACFSTKLNWFDMEAAEGLYTSVRLILDADERKTAGEAPSCPDVPNE